MGVPIEELHRRVAINLRALRTARGLSQEDFAEAIGWHRNSIGKLERAEQDMRLSTLARLSTDLALEPLVLLQPVSKDATIPSRKHRSSRKRMRQRR